MTTEQKDELLDAAWHYVNGHISCEDYLSTVEVYSSASNNGKPIVSGYLPGWAAELFTEVRFRLLVDIDEDGEPRSSMAELLEMWDNVNKALDIKTIGQ